MWNIIWDIGFIVINHNGIYTHCWPLHSSLADKSLKVTVRWYNMPIIGGKHIIFAVSSEGGTYCEQDGRSGIMINRLGHLKLDLNWWDGEKRYMCADFLWLQGLLFGNESRMENGCIFLAAIENKEMRE